MTKIKALSATVLLFAAAAPSVFAQEGGVLGSRNGLEPSNSANSEKAEMRHRENSGMSSSEMTEPGDFAATGGTSDRSRAGNPTGQVDPGTSNSPGPNSGGE